MTWRPNAPHGKSYSGRPPPPSLDLHEATRLDRYRDTLNEKVQEIVSRYDHYDGEDRHTPMEMREKERKCYNEVQEMVKQHSKPLGLEHIFEQSTGKIDQPVSTKRWLYTPFEPSSCGTTNETSQASRHPRSHDRDGQDIGR